MFRTSLGMELSSSFHLSLFFVFVFLFYLYPTGELISDRIIFLLLCRGRRLQILPTIWQLPQACITVGNTCVHKKF